MECAISFDSPSKAPRGNHSAADFPRQAAVNDVASIFRLEVVIGRSTVNVELIGEIDLAAVPKLTTLLESLDGLHMTICIDMAAVTFIDCTGLLPIVDTARRRERQQLPPVKVGECSLIGRRLLLVTGLGAGPVLDLVGWETFWGQLD